MRRGLIWVAGVVVVAVVAATGFYAYRQDVSGSDQDLAVMATPVGITLQVVSLGGDRDKEKRPRLNANGEPISTAISATVFANARALTLYTYDKDTTPNKSTCMGDCAKAWSPAVPAPNAKPVGEWSIIAPDDGSRQWAYRAKPLYNFIGETMAGEAKGHGTDGEWRAAMFQPESGIAFPEGITLHETSDATGQVLVNADSKTLYVFSGDVAHDLEACGQANCAQLWTPLSAGQINNPTRDFTIINRNDGFAQWAYKGRPLYTYAGDIEPGDVNGDGAGKQWHAATVIRYFMPDNVTIQQAHGRGPTLATDKGMTLYRHDAFRFSTNHNTPEGTRGIAVVGHKLGLTGCDETCLKTWHPFAAPADAQPSGYWEVATRSDGTKQWVYKGYALYAYAGDSGPGDFNGHDIYDFLSDDGVHKAAIPISDNPYLNRSGGPGALVWQYAIP